MIVDEHFVEQTLQEADLTFEQTARQIVFRKNCRMSCKSSTAASLRFFYFRFVYFDTIVPRDRYLDKNPPLCSRSLFEIVLERSGTSRYAQLGSGRLR